MGQQNHPLVHRFAHLAMRTTFEVVIAGKDKVYSLQVSQAIFEEIDRIETLLSHFDPCSEIGQINHLKPGQSLRIGIEVFDCLKTAVRIQRETNGAFDVNITSLIKYMQEVVPRSDKKAIKIVCGLLNYPAHQTDLRLQSQIE